MLEMGEGSGSFWLEAIYNGTKNRRQRGAHVKVIILSGFLGAGKTSVLLQMASRLTEMAPEVENRLVIIENEVGDIGVDDRVLAGSAGYTVRNLFSGCICCTLTGELLASLKQLQCEIDPQFIIVEPSGVADASVLARRVGSYLACPVRVVGIADAARWELVVHAMEQLLANQTSAAHVVLLNKADLVDEETLVEVEKSIRTYNDTAPVLRIAANKNIDTEILDAAIGNEE